MLTRKHKFYQTLQENPCTSVVTSDGISAIQCMYSGPCPVGNLTLKQKYYRVKKRYSIKRINSTNILCQTYYSEPPQLLRVVPKEELFDIFEKVHSEDNKHLGRDRLFFQLKKRYSGFSRKLVLAFVALFLECQL